MDKKSFIERATTMGWAQDRFGHLKKTVNGKQYRFKLSRIAVRYEVHTNTKPARWVRIYSGYFSKLSFTTNGTLVGMKR